MKNFRGAFRPLRLRVITVTSEPVATMDGSSELTATTDIPSVVMRSRSNSEHLDAEFSETLNPELSNPGRSPIPVPDYAVKNGMLPCLGILLGGLTLLQLPYPAPDSFADSCCNENVNLFREAPWIYYEALVDTSLVELYDMDGWSPGVIHVGSTMSLGWLDGCNTALSNLSVCVSRTVNGVLQDFMAVYYGLNRLRTLIQVNPSIGLDIHIYQNLGEVPYARRLAGFTDVMMEG